MKIIKRGFYLFFFIYSFMTSAIKIGGKLYIIGGNRRMTYYVLSGINPTIWLIKL